MSLDDIKRKLKRVRTRTRSWSKIAKLTLSGNKIEKTTDLKNCRNPILMVYGFGATRRTLSILENRLRQDGYTIFSLNLGGFFGTFNTQSIEDSAHYIQNKIEKLYEKHDIRGKLSIVGHSKGGLIGQYYIKILSGTKRVKTLITLGTPHNGTPWCLVASFTPIPWLCKSLKQMAPTSSFIQKIKEIPFPKKVKVYSIYSKDDIVCPFPVSVLDETENVKNIEIPGCSHSELLIKKSVYNAIKHGLRHEMPESWTETSQQNYKDHMEQKKTKLKVIRGEKA